MKTHSRLYPTCFESPGFVSGVAQVYRGMKILCLYCASLSSDVLYPVVAAAPTCTIIHIAALTRTVIVVAAITIDVALHPLPLSPERASHDHLSK
jgi:hypothetical protein